MSVCAIRKALGFHDSMNTHTSGITQSAASRITPMSAMRSPKARPSIFDMLISSVSLPATRDPHLDAHADQHECEQHLCRRRGVAERPLAEAGFVDELHDRPRRVVR